MLEHALKYFERGVSVVPIRRFDDPNKEGATKVPYIKWAKYQKEKQTEADMERGFEKFPTARLGAVCGKISGIATVDIDSEIGLAHFLKMTRNISKICVTSGKGYHFWYKHPGGKIKSHRLCEDIDIKADGGTIMLPPSPYDAEVNYKWKDDDCTFFNTELPDFPVEILSTITTKSHTSKVEMYLQGCVEGERNEGAAIMAGFYLREFDKEQKAKKALYRWNDQNDPPLKSIELDTIFGSIVARDRAKISNEKLSVEIEKFNNEKKALGGDLEAISDRFGFEIKKVYFRKPIVGDSLLYIEANSEVMFMKPSEALTFAKLRNIIVDNLGLAIPEISGKYFKVLSQSLIDIANKDVRGIDYRNSDLQKYVSILEEICVDSVDYKNKAMLKYEPYVDDHDDMVYFSRSWMLGCLKRLGDNKTSTKMLIDDLKNLECKEVVIEIKEGTKLKVWVTSITKLIKKGMLI